MRSLICVLLAVISLAIAACSSTPVNGEATSDMPKASLEALGAGTPLPQGAAIKHDKSLIMGAGDNWVGRVVVDVGRDPQLAYQFFYQQYPSLGWTLVTSLRGKTSLLVFSKDDRNATVEIEDGGLLLGSTLVLTVSPRNAGAMPPGPNRR
jgi:hypothetical protein